MVKYIFIGNLLEDINVDSQITNIIVFRDDMHVFDVRYIGIYVRNLLVFSLCKFIY